ncbi:MAG: NAD(P)H-hydrate dehydratase, partial [Bacteroidota bacterium]
IIVDAIFGIGLNRPPADWVKRIIADLNTSDAFTLAVDIPSGLFMERAVEDREAVIQADYVLSFQSPKLVFFLPETGVFLNQWEVLDIGLDRTFLSQTETDFGLVGKNEVLAGYRPRPKFSHKGTYGHALVIGGSYGKMGAVVLAAQAALKAGSGLVSTYVPQCGYTIVQTAFPEGMTLTDTGERKLTDIDYALEPQGVGIGIGMGTDKATVNAFSNFLSKNKTPMVIDADAINILAKNKALLKEMPKGTVLTPHPKELQRLIGSWKDDFGKLKKARSFSKKYDCVLVIKGAHTLIVYQGKGYINVTGNPGMATAGSGDVLTGILTGLMAQGYPPLQATIFGVYLHGRAGDIQVEHTGYQALTASVIIEGIGPAFLDLFAPPEKQEVVANKEE